MRRSLLPSLLLAATVLTVSLNISAQTTGSGSGSSWSGWAYGDLSPTSYGVEAGFNWGSSRFNVGPAAGIFHPYRTDRFTPEAEFYLGFIANIQTSYLWVYAGGGVIYDGTDYWSGRLSIWWISDDPVGLYATLFASYTPLQGSMTEANWYIQPRLGVEVRASRAIQIAPYLQLGVNAPSGTVAVAPGCVVLASF